jgi:hypothetical protein
MRKVLFLLFICLIVSIALPQGIIYAAKGTGPTYDFSLSRSLPYQAGDMVLFENVILGNQRYEMIMQWNKAGTFKPVSTKLLRTVQIPYAQITIDGIDSDWAGIPPVDTDPEGDKASDSANIPGSDLKAVYIARDDTYLYFRMTMYDDGPTAALYVVEFQQYLNQIHTPGDLYCAASYDGTNKGLHVAVRGPGGFLTSYPPDYVALGLGWLEWKVPITAIQYPDNTPAPYNSPVTPPPGIENQFIRAYIHPDATSFPSDANDELNRPMIIKFYQ